MAGRYGPDNLYYAMLVAYVVFIVLNIAFRRYNAISFIFYLLSWLTLIFAFFRVMSKKIYKRSEENTKFLKVWNKVKNFFSLNLSKIKDFPEKKYAKCPHCKSNLRLPRIRGKHTVRCPRCDNRFDVRIFIGTKNKNPFRSKNNV